jgi:hypothetical protein
MCQCGDSTLVASLVLGEGICLFTFEHDGIGNELDIYILSLTTL